MSLNRKYLEDMNGEFFKLPNAILFIGLSPSALYVYAWLAEVPGYFNPSLHFTANALKMTEKTVAKALAELCEAGVIIRNPEDEAEKHPERNVYRFVEVKKWKVQPDYPFKPKKTPTGK